MVKQKIFLFLLEISYFATCAHHISCSHCAPLKRVHLHLPPVLAASCRHCAPSGCSPWGSFWVLIAAWSCPYCHVLIVLIAPSELWEELGRGEKWLSPLCQLYCGSNSMICGYAARVHLWLVLNSLRIGLPRSSAKLLPWSWVIPSLGQNLVFALDGIYIGPFFIF